MAKPGFHTLALSQSLESNSARLFRKPQLNGWESVIERVRAQLASAGGTFM
jgi:hypothetical protein